MKNSDQLAVEAIKILNSKGIPATDEAVWDMMKALDRTQAVREVQVKLDEAEIENEVLRDALREIADCIVPVGMNKLNWLIKTAKETLETVNA